MTPDNREELVSAYIDDELSPEERGRVEQWLAESAELRRFHDELRAVRARLQALPRHSLNRDLASRVIRQAEQTVLKGQEPSPAADILPGTIVRQWWSQGRGWRSVVWPAVAIAAALLMYFDTRQKPAERQVAQHAPRGESSIGAQGGGGASQSDQPETLAKKREDAPKSDLAASPAAKSSDDSDEKEARDMPATSPTQRYAAQAKTAPAAAMRAKPAEAVGASAEKGGARGTLNVVDAEADSDELVEIDVKPVFVEEKQLEKSLDAKKIAWMRVETQQAANAEPPSKELPGSPPSGAKPANPKVASPEQQQKNSVQESQPTEASPQYFVTLTPAQLDQITDEFSQDRARVVRVRRGVAQQGNANNAQTNRAQSNKQNIAQKDKLEQAAQSNVVIRLVPVAEVPERDEAKP